MGKFIRQFLGIESVFPGSRSDQTYPSETSDFVQPVVEMPSRALRLREAGTFQLVSAAGVGVIFTSLNDKLVVYYPFIAFLLTEPGLARRFFLDIRQGSAGQAVAIYDSAADISNFAGGLVPDGVAICMRNLVQPPGHRIEANAVAIGAGGTIAIEGLAVVMGLSDPAPPGF